jgi:pimeloyl-ACP methyl ester carboxylesterase
LQAAPNATVACVRAFSGTDFRGDMKALTMKTLIVHGANDKTVPIEIAGAKAAAMVPHATFLTYEGAPHALVITDKDRFNKDLLAFLQ